MTSARTKRKVIDLFDALKQSLDDNGSSKAYDDRQMRRAALRWFRERR